MSRSAPQPDHAAVDIQELLAWVPKHSIHGTSGPSATPNRPFMPFPELEAYLQAQSRTSKLLRALYFDREHHVIVEILERSYMRVFTILILIGKGRYIEHFVEHLNLRDHQLPFLEKPAHFPTDPDDPTFWASFYEKQFAFCAHHFRYNENYTKLEDLCILPIISKEMLRSGGSAAIYKITLHPYYDQLSSAAEIPVNQTQAARPANTYVLKTYNTKDANSYYENEVGAFKKLATKDRDDKSLIHFLGSYKQGDTHNILLEYADCGTLEDFFQKVPPPSLGEDIVMFWGRLFNVFKALSFIHATDPTDGFSGLENLTGWHQDVKPSNILVLSGNRSHPYDVHFKLADLGLSHFKRTAKLDRRIVDSDVGGTKDYGAPECHRPDEFFERSKLNVRPLVDIWSFGGICSEAAAWVVLGMPGLNNYRYQRQQEIAGKDTMQDGSCFHDGEKVLRSVEYMHDRLLKGGEVRPGDHITKPVLDHMVTSMLMEDPDGRENALRLWKRSRKILDEAQAKLEESRRPNTLIHVDAMVNKVQSFVQHTPGTPSQNLHGAAQQYNGLPHAYGPPPHHPQYSPNPQMLDRNSSIKQTPKRRSDTCYEHNSGTDMTSASHHGSLTPPITSRQSVRASPPLDKYPVFQDRSDTRPTVPDETVFGAGGDDWHNVNPLSYSPPNGSRNVYLLERPSVSQQGSGESAQPESNSSSNVHLAQQTQSDAGLEATPLRKSGALGSQLESDLQHLKMGTFTGHEPSHPMPGNTSDETCQNTPPRTPRHPPIATAITVEPSASKIKPNRPRLSFKEAKQVRERRTSFSRHASNLLNDLKNRDHVFLIDDSSSMQEHWDVVVEFFSVFAWFAKRLDDNGLEMYFTVSKNKETFKDTTPAVKHLKSMTPSGYPNIDIRLGQLLGKYQTDLERRKEQRNNFWSRGKDVKPLSLYVFTDAAWPGCDAVAPIEAMIEKQRQLALPKEQIGIQFIRFGNDPKGIERLEYLDSGLRKKYGKKHDIVDSEPFDDGNLLKMLLGAISEWFDDDEMD